MAEATGSSGLVDIKIEIKEEPVFVEASTAESDDLDHADDPLKEEIKDEEEVDVDLLKDEVIVGEPSCSSEEASRLHTVFQPENSVADVSNKKEHKCDICGKIFALGSVLKKHMVIHCDFSSLQQHESTHRGIKSYKCDFCGKSYSSKQRITGHIMVHMDKSPYRCDICGRIFNDVFNLKRHMLCHTGIKPYRCAICGKSYTSKQNLRSHSLVHEDKEIHRCNSCGKSFAHNYKLKKHTLSHIRERNLVC